jgi:hypothetical protein
MVSDVNLNNLVALTITLQFVFFGWRLVREIAIGDKEKDDKGRVWRTWLPWPDRVNLLSLILVAGSCLVAPIVMGRFTALGRAVLVGAVILWMCHPLALVCHYEFHHGGRRRKYGHPGLWPVVTPSEASVVKASIGLAIVGAAFAWWSITH